jgi:hypothetical protein
MTVASNNAPIDPVKLEKLAEVAIKTGLQLQKGQDLVITDKTCLSGRRWSRHHILFRRRDDTRPLSPRKR